MVVSRTVKRRKKGAVACSLFLVYVVGRVLLTVVWPDVPSVQIITSFLVLLPILYAAFAFYEIGGIVSALATIGLNLLLRAVFRQDATLDPEILWSTWAAAIGIGALLGYIVRVNTRLRAERKRLEVTIREANHRIKNSLNLAVSVVGAERSVVTHRETADALETVEGRVGAIAELHDLLAWGDMDGHINLADYLAGVVTRVQRATSLAAQVDFAAVETVMVPSSQATALGMICIELLINIAQHDTDEGGAPTATVSGASGPAGIAITVASDRGAFDPAPSRQSTRSGLGAQLIEALVEQLKGSFEIASRTPPRFTVSFVAAEAPSRDNRPARRSSATPRLLRAFRFGEGLRLRRKRNVA